MVKFVMVYLVAYFIKNVCDDHICGMIKQKGDLK